MAIILASAQGFLGDFVGPWSLYWSEAFLILITLRALIARRPARAEIAAAGLLAAIFLAYLVTGTEATAVFWGAKLLLSAAVLGWAAWRLGSGSREWLGLYYGLVVAVGANVIYAAWQRHEGVSGLGRLGVAFGERIRVVEQTHLRAFAGFTSAAPFSYTCALALFAWLALMLAETKHRRIALLTAWLPVAAIVGIVWSLDRAAVAFTIVAILVVATCQARPAVAAVLAVSAAGAAAAIFALAGPTARHFLFEGLSGRSQSAIDRRTLWRAYAHDLNALGQGPATAGAAYAHVAPPKRKPPLFWGKGWEPLERTPDGLPYRYMGTTATALIWDQKAPRPAVTFTARARSFSRPRVLTIRANRSLVARVRVPYDRYVPLRIRLAGGAGPVRLQFATVPPADPGTYANPEDHRLLAAWLLDTRVVGLPLNPGRTPAERAYQRAFAHANNKELFGTVPVGVVDNLYLSWLFQYGMLLGGAICIAWIGALAWPLRRRHSREPSLLALQFSGVFLIAAALVVNVWEEPPGDVVAALTVACAVGATRAASRRAAGDPPAGQSAIRSR